MGVRSVLRCSHDQYYVICVCISPCIFGNALTFLQFLIIRRSGHDWVRCLWTEIVLKKNSSYFFWLCAESSTRGRRYINLKSKVKYHLNCNLNFTVFGDWLSDWNYFILEVFCTWMSFKMLTGLVSLHKVCLCYSSISNPV